MMREQNSDIDHAIYCKVRIITTYIRRYDGNKLVVSTVSFIMQPQSGTLPSGTSIVLFQL